MPGRRSAGRSSPPRDPRRSSASSRPTAATTTQPTTSPASSSGGTSTNMQIDVTEPQAGTAVLTLDGRLNMVSAPHLKTAITEAVEGGRARVVVDLAGVG